MTVITAFPTMVDKIITALGAASSLTDIRVFDGAEVDASYPKDAIAIGHDGSFGDSEITAGTARNSPLAFTDVHEEAGTISCALWSQDGASKFAPLRVRAFALLSAVDSVIRADPTFTGTCLYSYLESDAVAYRTTSQGNSVVLTFTITYQAQS